MEHDTDIGPFSHLRKGAYVCAHAHIGNYGEMKNSTLGPGAKMGHFSYLGDTMSGKTQTLGQEPSLVISMVRKSMPTRSVITYFIGSGTLIVAPIEIGDNAATGAGSVVTHDIPENTLVYGVPAREKEKKEPKLTEFSILIKVSNPRKEKTMANGEIKLGKTYSKCESSL